MADPSPAQPISGAMLAPASDYDAMSIAEAYAWRGDKDKALSWLDRAYAQKDVSLYTIAGDPLLKNLEGEPRYVAFLRKMNVPD